MIFRVVAFFSTTILMLGGLWFAPKPEISLDLASASGSYFVKAADLSLVCPGSLFQTGGESGTNLSQIERASSSTTKITASGQGSIELSSLSSSAPEQLDLDGSRVFETRSNRESLRLTNLNSSTDAIQGSMTLTGSSFQLASEPAMKGFAATSCQLPSNDFYLVGGSTAPGREALLVLTNPSPIDATADLKIFTDLGEVEVAGLAGISVPANSTNVISLASFAPTTPTLALHVISSGAKLAGWIQQRAVRGTSATGVDWISPSPLASLNSVIPGVVIRGTKTINQNLDAESNSDATHALRIFAPEGAEVTVQITSSDSEVFGAVFTGTIEPGTVSDFPITELKDGDYSIFIASDKPVYASARVARGNPGQTPRLDFAWVPAAEEIVGERAVYAHDQGLSILVLANSSSETQSVVIQNLLSGVKQSVSVPASGTASLEVAGAISVAAAGSVYGAVAILVEGQLSDLEIRDPKNSGSEIKVRFN